MSLTPQQQENLWNDAVVTSEKIFNLVQKETPDPAAACGMLAMTLARIAMNCWGSDPEMHRAHIPGTLQAFSLQFTGALHEFQQAEAATKKLS